jgi:hypothetical protein
MFRKIVILKVSNEKHVTIKNKLNITPLKLLF